MLVWVPFEEMFDYMLTCGTPEVDDEPEDDDGESGEVEPVYRVVLSRVLRVSQGDAHRETRHA